jgi:hypothetical protein
MWKWKIEYNSGKLGGSWFLLWTGLDERAARRRFAEISKGNGGTIRLVRPGGFTDTIVTVSAAQHRLPGGA